MSSQATHLTQQTSTTRPVLTLAPTNVDVLSNCVGSGRVVAGSEGWRLTIGPESGRSYANAQLDDYHHDHAWRWQPPLRLTVMARFSHAAAELRGTAGFGFWNDPVGMTLHGRLRPPQTAWFFFGAPPTNLPFANGVPGWGWKAATLDASRLRSLGATLLVPVAWAAAQWPRTHHWLWPKLQRLWQIGEQPLDVDLREWHEYTLVWQRQRLEFRVDSQVALVTPYAPRGPLGLVVWIDNQYMIATPQGHFGAGCVATGEQWVEIKRLELLFEPSSHGRGNETRLKPRANSNARRG
jgi:hypothetical protein